MANNPMGANFWEGVLGVVNIEFNGVDLGKTTADTEIQIDQDIKDIIFQQNGTKYSDKVRTGVVYNVTCTFGEISTSLIETVMTGNVASQDGKSLKMGRSIYQSMKDNESYPLVLKRVDSDGNSSADKLYQMKFYKASAMVTGNFQFGADTQRNIAVTFAIYWDETKDAFGYSGYASCFGLSN
jgi:hypothetical protein